MEKQLQSVVLEGYPFSLTIGGAPIKEIRRVTFDTGYHDDIPKMHVEVNMLPGSEVKYSAEVSIEVMPPEGCSIIRLEGNGCQIWRCVRTEGLDV